MECERGGLSRSTVSAAFGDRLDSQMMMICYQPVRPVVGVPESCVKGESRR